MRFTAGGSRASTIPQKRWSPKINRANDSQSHAPLEVDVDLYPFALLLSPVTGELFFQSFSETLGTPGLTETLTLLRKKVFAETTLLSEVFTRKIRRSFSETASLAEAFTKKMFRAFAETVSLAETLATKAVFKRAFAETLNSLSEAFVKKVLKGFAETSSLSEAFGRTLKRSMLETLSFAEAFSTQFIAGSAGALGKVWRLAIRIGKGL